MDKATSLKESLHWQITFQIQVVQVNMLQYEGKKDFMPFKQEE